MCFSVEVEKELKKLAKFFRAQVSYAHFEYLEALRLREKDTSWLKGAVESCAEAAEFFLQRSRSGLKNFSGILRSCHRA